MAEALYRKYRPQVFSDVVGQDHIEQTLKNALQQDKVSHAYLFCGPRGTGKTTTARLLAKALLCENGPTPQPDGTCEDCQLIARGEHPDVYELDAASRTGVENVREEIIGRVQFAPTRGSYKVYIIDEVHMLSTAAFNALLKTLEEPPSHVVFILCTTDPQKVPETIHSRCQRFDFRRISQEYIVERLGAVCEAEGVPFEGEALELIAHRAEGGLRNALTALEQVISFGGNAVSLEAAESVLGSLDTTDLAEIVVHIGKRDVASCFAWVANYVETGSDLAQFTRDLAEHTRNLYVMSLAGADVDLDVSAAVRTQMRDQLTLFGPDRLARMMSVLGDLTVELKTSTNPRLSFEIACTRLVRPDSDLTLESLAERIEALEAGLSARMHAPAAAQLAEAVPRVHKDEPTSRSANSRQAVARPEVQPQQEAQRVDDRPRELVSAETKASRVVARTEEPEPVTPAQLGGDVRSILTNQSSLQRAWQGAVNFLKKDKPAYAVLLMSAHPVFDQGKNLLLVDFPQESAFAYKAVQKPEVSESLGHALKAVCGAAVPFAFVQLGGGAAPVAAQPQPERVRQEVRVSQAQPQAVQQAARQQQAQPQQQARQTQQPMREHQQAQPAREHRARTQQVRPVVDTSRYDEVPLDAYESSMPYSEPDTYDDVPPWEPTPQPAARQPLQGAQRQSAQPQVQQSQPTQHQASPAGNESPEAMGQMLSGVFGDTIRFE